MITLFTIPKPFTDPHIRTIQRNALQSWKRIHPEIQILVLGNDEGVAETAQEFGIAHLSDVAVTEYGTPRLDSAFSLVREHARYDIIMYANADMIFTDDIIPAIAHAPAGPFLMCGRRWDLNIASPIDFSKTDWMGNIRNQARKNGQLHSEAGMDYFLFRKESFLDMPALVVGRVGWDNWMIWYSKKHSIPVINITPAIIAVHQNHGYPANLGREVRKRQPEGLQNFSFIGDMRGDLTSNGANLIMDKKYRLKRNYAAALYPLKKFIRALISR